MKNDKNRNNNQIKVRQEGQAEHPELGREVGVDFPRLRRLELNTIQKTKEKESLCSNISGRSEVHNNFKQKKIK